MLFPSFLHFTSLTIVPSYISTLDTTSSNLPSFLTTIQSSSVPPSFLHQLLFHHKYFYPRSLQSSPFQCNDSFCFPPFLHLVPSYISTLATSRTHKTLIRQRVKGTHPIYSHLAPDVLPLPSRQCNLSSPSFPFDVCSAAPSFPASSSP